MRGREENTHPNSCLDRDEEDRTKYLRKKKKQKQQTATHAPIENTAKKEEDASRVALANSNTCHVQTLQSNPSDTDKQQYQTEGKGPAAHDTQ